MSAFMRIAKIPIDSDSSLTATVHDMVFRDEDINHETPLNIMYGSSKTTNIGSLHSVYWTDNVLNLKRRNNLNTAVAM